MVRARRRVRRICALGATPHFVQRRLDARGSGRLCVFGEQTIGEIMADMRKWPKKSAKRQKPTRDSLLAGAAFDLSCQGWSHLEISILLDAPRSTITRWINKERANICL